jgi:hypothetical protein
MVIKRRKISKYEKAADHAGKRWDKLFAKVLAYSVQGEALFRHALQVAEENGDAREICEGHSRLVSFLVTVGWTGKADQLLRRWIARFPDSNEARLAAADYLWYSRWQTQKTMAQLKHIKLSKHPANDDIDTYYIAQEMKGQVLLADEKTKAAVRQMKVLADFTEANFEQIQFFFELRFVTKMIDRQLALKDCLRYLVTLSRRKQVEHDQLSTKMLVSK